MASKLKRRVEARLAKSYCQVVCVPAAGCLCLARQMIARCSKQSLGAPPPECPLLPHTLSSMRNLACALHSAGRHVEVVEMYHTTRGDACWGFM